MAIQGSSPNLQTADESQNLMPMKSRVIHKFYEPLVFLKALNVEMVDVATYISPSEPDHFQDPQKLFEIFVYKLSHVCDSVKGDQGGTITSIAVLQREDNRTIEYRFASNQRTEEELNATASFMRTLLQTIGEAQAQPFAQTHATQRVLLRSLLLFNRRRINVYLRALWIEAQKCVDRPPPTGIDDGSSISLALGGLLELFDPEWIQDCSESEYLRDCDVVIRHLTRLNKSIAGEQIDQLARDIRGRTMEDSMVCWPEFRHMMNRLLAYRQSVEFFLLANNTWPQLFRDFQVCYIPSSQPMAKPIRQKSLTAEGIVGRMTRKARDIKIFRDFAEELQLFGLDDRIVAEYDNEHFRPIVHSEVLLLDWLQRNGGVKPARFFQAWKYIGTSKPTCKLCRYYFEEHRSGVGHRSSHGNLYVNWRVPDVLQSQCPEAEEKRQIMVDRVIVRIRKDAFDLVKKRARPTYRAHDSITSSARLTLQVTSDADDVASRMGELGLSDDDDENEGGVML